MIEKLLELLIDKIDTNLLKAIVLKNLKTINIQDSTEVGLLQRCINKSVITLDDQPLEETVKDGSGDTSNSIGGLLTGLTLGHPLSSDLNSWLAEGFDEGRCFHSIAVSNLSRVSLRSNLFTLSLIITTLGLELNFSRCQNTSSQHVTFPFFLVTKSKNIEGILGEFKILIVIDGLNSSFSLGYI